LNDLPKFEEDLGLKLLEFPLQTFATLTDVRLGLWVRNGYSIKNQCLNYLSPSLREGTADLDFVAMSASLSICGSEPFLKRVAAYMLLNTQDQFYQGRAEDFFVLIINLFCNRVLKQESIPSRERMESEMINRIALGPITFSDLSSQLTDSTCSSPQFESILAEIAELKLPLNDESAGVYELKPQFYSRVDPYCSRFLRKDRVAIRQVFKLKGISHVIQKDLIAIPEIDSLANSRYLMELIYDALLFCLQDPGQSETLMSEIVHLLSLFANRVDKLESQLLTSNLQYEFKSGDCSRSVLHLLQDAKSKSPAKDEIAKLLNLLFSGKFNTLHN
jgi:E3 ubiquitin-protein ligase UBR1